MSTTSATSNLLWQESGQEPNSKLSDYTPPKIPTPWKPNQNKPEEFWIDLAQTQGPAGREDCQAGWHHFVGNFLHGQRILDVGAGLGRSRERLQVNGNSVTLQEPSPGMEGIDISCDLGVLAVNLPYDANIFDVVTAFDVIEHIKHADSFLMHCFLLAPTVILTTPNYFVHGAGNPHHIREYTPEGLLALFDSEVMQQNFPNAEFRFRLGYGSQDGANVSDFIGVEHWKDDSHFLRSAPQLYVHATMKEKEIEE